MNVGGRGGGGGGVKIAGKNTGIENKCKNFFLAPPPPTYDLLPTLMYCISVETMGAGEGGWRRGC